MIEYHLVHQFWLEKQQIEVDASFNENVAITQLDNVQWTLNCKLRATWLEQANFCLLKCTVQILINFKSIKCVCFSWITELNLSSLGLDL